MRTFIAAAFVFLFFSVSTPTAFAQATCPVGCTADISGTCYSNTDGVTPCGTQTGVTNTPTQTQPGVTNTGGSGGTVLINPLGAGTTLNSFLLSILNIITNTIGPVIVILMLVYVGFKFVTAQGSDSALTEARKMLLWTLVGALVLLGAKVIAIGIQATVQALSTGG